MLSNLESTRNSLADSLSTSVWDGINDGRTSMNYCIYQPEGLDLVLILKEWSFPRVKS